jgi:hypothetical protein
MASSSLFVAGRDYPLSQLFLPENRTSKNSRKGVYYTRKSAIEIHPKILLNNLFIAYIDGFSRLR